MNRVVLIGRLVRDPELKFAAGSGTAVCNFTLAVNRMKKKDQEKAEADFINCVSFGKIAETIAQYLTKGRQIAIAGSIRTGSYEAQDRTKRYTTDVYVDSFDFIDSKGNSENQSSSVDNRFAGASYYDDMTPVNDGDIPF